MASQSRFGEESSCFFKLQGSECKRGKPKVFVIQIKVEQSRGKNGDAKWMKFWGECRVAENISLCLSPGLFWEMIRSRMWWRTVTFCNRIHTDEQNRPTKIQKMHESIWPQSSFQSWSPKITTLKYKQNWKRNNKTIDFAACQCTLSISI